MITLDMVQVLGSQQRRTSMQILKLLGLLLEQGKLLGIILHTYGS
jgi:hypothetical protein